MPACRVCGSTDRLNRECTYCGRVHCTKHRLPENHDCDAVGEASWAGWGAENKRRRGQASRSWWQRLRDRLPF